MLDSVSGLVSKRVNDSRNENHISRPALTAIKFRSHLDLRKHHFFIDQPPQLKLARKIHTFATRLKRFRRYSQGGSDFDIQTLGHDLTQRNVIGELMGADAEPLGNGRLSTVRAFKASGGSHELELPRSIRIFQKTRDGECRDFDLQDAQSAVSTRAVGDPCCETPGVMCKSRSTCGRGQLPVLHSFFGKLILGIQAPVKTIGHTQ